VDEPAQVDGIAQGAGHRVAQRLGDRVDDVLERDLQRGERRAQVVGDVGEVTLERVALRLEQRRVAADAGVGAVERHADGVELVADGDRVRRVARGVADVGGGTAQGADAPHQRDGDGDQTQRAGEHRRHRGAHGDHGRQPARRRRAWPDDLDDRARPRRPGPDHDAAAATAAAQLDGGLSGRRTKPGHQVAAQRRGGRAGGAAAVVVRVAAEVEARRDREVPARGVGGAGRGVGSGEAAAEDRRQLRAERLAHDAIGDHQGAQRADQPRRQHHRQHAHGDRAPARHPPSGSKR
jgi:hypothetical protein